jgi:hypothetical protein
METQTSKGKSMQSYILDATSGFHRNGIIELFMHNADGMEWYRAKDVEQRIAELEVELATYKAEIASMDTLAANLASDNDKLRKESA